MVIGIVTNHIDNRCCKCCIVTNVFKSIKKSFILIEIIMNTFLGIVLFAVIFVVVVRAIRQTNKSTTLPYNSGTGNGGTGNGGSSDTGRDEDKFKL
jgi:hypothetical protein